MHSMASPSPLLELMMQPSVYSFWKQMDAEQIRDLYSPYHIKMVAMTP